MILLFIHLIVCAALWTGWMMQDYLIMAPPCQEVPLQRRRRRRRYQGCNHRIIHSNSGTSMDSTRAVCSRTPSLGDVAEETPSQLPLAPKRQRIPFLTCKEQELLEWNIYKKHQEEDARSLHLQNFLQGLQIPVCMLSPEPWVHSRGAPMPYEGWYQPSPEQHERGPAPHSRSPRHVVQRTGSRQPNPGQHGRSPDLCIQRPRAQSPGPGHKRASRNRRSPKAPKQRTRLWVQRSGRQSPKGQGTSPERHSQSPRARNRSPIPLPHSLRNDSRSPGHRGASLESRWQTMRTRVSRAGTHVKSHRSHACPSLPSSVELLSSLLPVSQSKSHRSLQRGPKEGQVASIEQKILQLSSDDHTGPEMAKRHGDTPKPSRVAELSFTDTAVICKDPQIVPLVASGQFEVQQESHQFVDRLPKTQSPAHILVKLVHEEEARQELHLGLPKKSSSPGRLPARGLSTSPCTISRFKSHRSLQGEGGEKMGSTDQKPQWLTWTDISEPDFQKANKKAANLPAAGQPPILQLSIIGQNQLEPPCLFEVDQESHRSVDQPAKPQSPANILVELVHEEEAKQQLHMSLPKRPSSPGRLPARELPTSPPLISRSKSHKSLQGEGGEKMGKADQKSQWLTWTDISDPDFQKANKKAANLTAAGQPPILQLSIMGQNQHEPPCLFEVDQESHRFVDQPPKPQSPAHILVELVHEEEARQELHLGLPKKPSSPGRLPARGLPTSPRTIRPFKSHRSLQGEGGEKMGSADQKPLWLTWTDISDPEFQKANMKAANLPAAGQPPILQLSIMGQNQLEPPCLFEVNQESHRSVDQPAKPQSPAHIIVELVHEEEAKQQLHMSLPNRSSSPGRLPAKELPTSPPLISTSKSHRSLQGEGGKKMGSADQKAQWLTWTDISESDFQRANKKVAKPPKAGQPPFLQPSIIGQNQLESPCLFDIYQESQRFMDQPLKPPSPALILAESVHEEKLHVGLPKRSLSPGRPLARGQPTSPPPINRSKSRSNLQGERGGKIDSTPSGPHPWQPGIPCLVYPQLTVQEEEIHMNLSLLLKIKKDQAHKWGIEPEGDVSWVQVGKESPSELKHNRNRSKLQKSYTKKGQPLGSERPPKPVRQPFIKKTDPRDRGHKAAPKDEKDSSTSTTGFLAKPSKRRNLSRPAKPEKESLQPKAHQNRPNLLERLILCLRKVWDKLRGEKTKKKKAHPKQDSWDSATHKQGSSSERVISEDEPRKGILLNNESSEPSASSSSTTYKEGHHWHQEVLFPQFLEGEDFGLSTQKRVRRQPRSLVRTPTSITIRKKLSKRRRPRETLD